MHNIKEIRNNLDLFKSSLKKRFLETDLNKILELDKKNRKLIQKKENLEIKKDLALETNQVHLEEEDQIDHQEMEREKVLVLKGEKNLKVEATDLKVLPLKNIAKKELNSKTF